MNQQVGTLQDRFHKHEAQHLSGEENVTAWGSLEDCPLADSIINLKKAAGFLGHPAITGFPEGPSTLGAFSQLGSPPGHSSIPGSAFNPHSSSPPLMSD